jgi:branched-chain amino acid transport system substrate-binding protein
MRKLAGIVTAMAVGLGMAACGTEDEGGGSSSNSDEIVIGSIHPLTGPLAGAGQLMDQGAKLAVNDINADGGIESLGGADLVLSSGDSKGEAETGQSEAQRLIDDGAVALVGTYQSDVTLNVASVAERSRVPFVIDVAVDDQILEQGYQNTFRIQPDASSMGQDGADRLLEIAEQSGQKVDSVAYIHEDSSFGTSVFDAFKKQAESKGISVAKEVPYTATNFSDATTQVREAAAANPDVIVGTGYYPDQLLVAKAVKALSPNIQALYGVANGAFDDENFPKDAGAAGEDVLSANYHYNAASDRTQEIRDRFEQEYGAPMQTAAMLSYQAVEVIAKALEEGGSADPGELREAISQVSVDDPLLAFDGPIEFDETGQNTNATVVVMQVQNGTVEQVAPGEFETTKANYPASYGG